MPCVSPAGDSVLTLHDGDVVAGGPGVTLGGRDRVDDVVVELDISILALEVDLELVLGAGAVAVANGDDIGSQAAGRTKRGIHIVEGRAESPRGAGRAGADDLADVQVVPVDVVHPDLRKRSMSELNEPRSRSIIIYLIHIVVLVGNCREDG